MKKVVHTKLKQNSLRRRYVTGNEKLDQSIHALIEDAGGSSNADFLEDIITTAIKLREDELDRGDVKMMTTSLKEIRYALKVFHPYRHVRKVALFGSARTPETSPDYKQAFNLSKAIVKEGWMVVTGAASGIMSAGNEGAGRDKSFGVNIRLPFEQAPNPTIADDQKLINFKYFFTRKLIFIRESDATVLCPGGFGTHDEGFETLTLVQTGKAAPRPIVCLDPPGSTYWSAWKAFLKNQLAKKHFIDPDDLGLLYFTHDAKAAVRYITHFYHNYHSSRYIDHRLVIRLKRPLKTQHLKYLNKNFKSILAKGNIEQFFKPFPEEENEPHTFEFARLALYFNRRHFAKLMQLIASINEG
jgi:uncharacterized protein (TIGR00730 family)